MMSKTGTIGYLGSYKVPEVVLGVNAFTLAAQAVNPKITTKLVMIDSWFDPAKEAAAVQTLANLGCDVVAQHTDSPAGACRSASNARLWCFGQGADMARFAPKTQLTAIEDIWGPYYISRAKALLDGTWKPDDAWWGMKEGTVVMAPYNKAMPANVRAAADKIIAGWKDGSYDVFTGPIADQSGAEKVAKGAAHGGQGPRGDRLVRQRRAELRLTPCTRALSRRAGEAAKPLLPLRGEGGAAKPRPMRPGA